MLKRNEFNFEKAISFLEERITYYLGEVKHSDDNEVNKFQVIVKDLRKLKSTLLRCQRKNVNPKKFEFKVALIGTFGDCCFIYDETENAIYRLGLNFVREDEVTYSSVIFSYTQDVQGIYKFNEKYLREEVKIVDWFENLYGSYDIEIMKSEIEVFNLLEDEGCDAQDGGDNFAYNDYDYFDEYFVDDED